METFGLENMGGMLGGIAMTALAVFAKELLDRVSKTKSAEKKSVPRYQPDEGWRKLCLDHFNRSEMNDGKIEQRLESMQEEIHDLAVEQAVVRSQLNRIELDHQTQCTGRKSAYEKRT